MVNKKKEDLKICIFNIQSFPKPVALNCSFSITALHCRIKEWILAESSNKLLLMFPYMVWQMWKPLFRLTNKLWVVLLYLGEGVFWIVHAACLSALSAWVVHEQWIRGGHVELKVKAQPCSRRWALILPDHYFEWWDSHAPSEVSLRLNKNWDSKAHIWINAGQTP